MSEGARPVYHFSPMGEEYLTTMDGWTYDAYFPDFDVEAYHASVRAGTTPPTGPAGCDGFAVLSADHGLTGIFEYYFENDGTASIGLALNPAITNQGLGRGFLEAGIAFLETNYNYGGSYVYLNVHQANVPALKLYQRAGFERISTETSDGDIRMRRRVQSA